MAHVTHKRRVTRVASWLVVLLMTVMVARPAPARAAGLSPALGPYDQTLLYSIAIRTWRFFSADVDPTTNLPMDNIGLYGAPAQGTYTSPTNIGVYFWSIVAAMDLHLISREQAYRLAAATLTTVERLTKWNGFLLSWYDTRNGNRIAGPGDLTSKEGQPLTGEFISTVDNGWYGAGLVILRQALPRLAARASALLNAMNYGVLFDNRGTASTNVTWGQMCGGLNVDTNPCPFDYGILNAETRIAAYMGIGTHTMNSAAWWHTWRTLPSTATAPPPGDTDAMAHTNFDWQGQYPPQGYWTTYADPQSGQPYTVFEGHYTYNGISFVPSWGGSAFEGLMPNLVVPETLWGTRSFGLNDKNYAQMQIAWATGPQTPTVAGQAPGLGYPVWGLSPSSTPDDTGNYDAYGANGPAYPRGIASNSNCCPYDQQAVTPHASFLALDVLPQEAMANIRTLRRLYPDLYGPYGFFDAVAPRAYSYDSYDAKGVKTTNVVRAGQVGHRYLVLDQAMIMAAIDNALLNHLMQRYFARDSVGATMQPYLSMEQFSL